MSGTSILDRMAAEQTSTKKNANARLTPRGAEKAAAPVVELPTIANHPAGVLPDDPDVVLNRLRDARREVEAILESITRLEVLWGKPEQAIAENAAMTAAALQKEKERRGDEIAAAQAGDKAAAKRVAEARPIEEVEKNAQVHDDGFAAKFAEQQKAAQAAVYKDGEPEDPPEKLFPAPPAAWSCEKHGKAEEATSRRGRPYLKCPVAGCEEFEHLV